MPTIFQMQFINLKFIFIIIYVLGVGSGLCVMGEKLYSPKTERANAQELSCKFH